MPTLRPHSPLLEEKTLRIALAALRMITQAKSRVILVEDSHSANLLDALGDLGATYIVSNLSQLDCYHLPASDRRHSADLVMQLCKAAVTVESYESDCVEGSRLAERFKSRLRALVDRDICTGYDPLTAAEGKMPPCKHQASLDSCPQIRSTPLNDIECTAFALRIGKIAEATGSKALLCGELNLPPDATQELVGAEVMKEWLVPLFCIRSRFARQSPPRSAKGICGLIGTGEFVRVLARSPAERGVKLARLAPPSYRSFSDKEAQILETEIEAIISKPECWPHFVHGHDLVQLMAVLQARASGFPFLQLRDFDCSDISQLDTTDGFKLIREWERKLVQQVRSIVLPNRTSLPGDEFPNELLRRLQD
jgi:hypothetical protein